MSGHTDSIEVLSKDQVELVPFVGTDGIGTLELAQNYVADDYVPDKVTTTCNPIEMKTELTKFESDISGTAKLVRSKGAIKIVARKGKTTYNQTTPNSVCINDITKNEFFKDCRMWHGAASGIFFFTEKQDYVKYREWSAFIDEEYRKQKIRASGVTK